MVPMIFSSRMDYCCVWINDFDPLIPRIFGHIGDSNLHICAGTGSADDLAAIFARMMAVVGEYQGSISAEHGIGVLKRKYLLHSRTKEEIALMHRLKDTLDPKGILNSGRVI